MQIECYLTRSVCLYQKAVMRERNARECHSELMKTVSNNALPTSSLWHSSLTLRLFWCRDAVSSQATSILYDTWLTTEFVSPSVL